MICVVAETARLILRQWHNGDREPFARMCADARVMEFFPSLLSRQHSDAVVDRCVEHFDRYGFGPCTAELRATGEFIGFIGPFIPRFEAHFTPCVEIGWRLAAEHWGRGLATEGAGAMVKYAFDTLGLPELVSFTVPANLRSRRVMEKLGMVLDPAGDFDHPRIPEGHPLRRHVLYRLQPQRWIGTQVRKDERASQVLPADA